MRRSLTTLLAAVLISGVAMLSAGTNPVAAYHDVCHPFEVGAPYKTGGDVRGWGDVRCDPSVYRLETHIEIWARDCGTCQWYRWQADWDACYGCSYKAASTQRGCASGTTRSYFSRVRGVYLMYYDQYYLTSWKQSGTRTITC